MAIMFVFTAMAAGYDKKIFIIQLLITAVAASLGVCRLFEARRDSRKFLEYIGGRLGAVKSDALTKFPLPVAVTDGEGMVLWTNALFRENEPQKTQVLPPSGSCSHPSDSRSKCYRSPAM